MSEQQKHKHKEHPAQALWSKIEWQTEGPHLVSSASGNATTTTTTSSSFVTTTPTRTNSASSDDNDRLQCYFAGNPEFRLPPLWKTASGQVLVQADLPSSSKKLVTSTAAAAAAAASNGGGTSATSTTSSTAAATAAVSNTDYCNGIALQRWHKAHSHMVASSILPSLVMVALLEESLQQLVRKVAVVVVQAEQQQREQAQRASSSSTAAASTGSTRRHKEKQTSSSRASLLPPPPPYYTTTPHSYLTAPTLQQQQQHNEDHDNDDESDLVLRTTTSTTPTVLWHTIKAGSALAHAYSRQLQHYQTSVVLQQQQQQQEQQGEQQDWNSTSTTTLVQQQQQQQQRRSRRLAAPLAQPTMPHVLVKGGRVATWWLTQQQQQQQQESFSTTQDKDDDDTLARQTVATSSDKNASVDNVNHGEENANANSKDEMVHNMEMEETHDEEEEEEASVEDDNDKNDDDDDDDDDDFEPSSESSSSSNDASRNDDNMSLDPDDLPSQQGDEQQDESSFSSSSQEESSDSDNDSIRSSERDDDYLIRANPHFLATRESLLDFVCGGGSSSITSSTGGGGGFAGRGRPAANSISMEHVQEAIVHLLQHHVAFSISLPLDALVVKYGGGAGNTARSSVPSTRGTQEQAVVLECTSGETVEELEQMDVGDFSKCKFHWKLQVDPDVREAILAEEQREREEKKQVALEEHYYAELAYKREKAWAWFRYKGITSGYTKWPQWTEAVTEWRRQEESQLKKSAQGTASIVSSSAGGGGGGATTEQTSSAAVAAASTTTTSANTDDDASLARAIQKQEEDSSASALAATSNTTARRSTRSRNAADGGSAVFYGGQAGLSHKQLMDTIVRMTYQQTFQTMVALSALVAEESNNPLHRIRVALGKLLWKHNQVTRVRVNSVWTDLPLWNLLVGNKEGLLQIPPQFKDDGQEQDSSQMDQHNGNESNAAATAEETVQSLSYSAKHAPTPENFKHLKVLEAYIRNLHQTEIELRSLILHHLTSTPIANVATAADERAGSLEAIDATDFEGDHSALDWSTSGHELLNQVVFRPSFLNASNDLSECSWYKIKDYVPSILMPPLPDQDDPTNRSDGRASTREIVIGKEPLAVERRMRFRAYPVTHNGEDVDEGAILVLTEGQVRAGIQAANLERKKESSDASLAADHPFAISAGTNVILQGTIEGAEGDVHCQIAGHDTVVKNENGGGSDSTGEQLEHRILLLPKLPEKACENGVASPAFWAVASKDESGTLTCRPLKGSMTYTILQSDCDSSSSAFQDCQAIVEFLYQQPHSQVFGEPVDPVALNIPTYFSVVKHPMDISTLSANLERGMYSKIPPGQNVARSPVARMLNGPFKDDVVRIFDNAMLFNPPDDWIHHTAASIKKAVLKKIDQLSREADDRFNGASPRRMKKSIYVDEDSDVDMYEYESDRDDDDYSGRRTARKRKRVGGSKDDFSTHAMEAPIALRKTLGESLGLRGPFSSLPIDSEAIGFSLSSEWNCRHKAAEVPEETKEDPEELKRKEEMEQLLTLHRQVEEMERAGLRRSSRAHPTESANANGGQVPPTTVEPDFEYFLPPGILPPLGDEARDAVLHDAASSRIGVEIQRETLHEVYFAKLYQQLSKFLQPIDNDYGSYVNSSFPPFLGRVVPSVRPENVEGVTWEIRAPYILPAIRWVLRGLVASGHIIELDSDVLLTNDIYYADDSQQPFDVLDLKEIQRRKRANAASEEEESEEEVEMSEYEKMRAERVARNAERLKALGLA